MKTFIYLWAIWLTVGFSSNAQAQLSAERAMYLSGNQTLQGVLYRPKGNGPFPVIVFVQHTIKSLHPSESTDLFPQLADLFVSKGYIFFIPGRHSPVNETNEKKSEGAQLVKNYDEHAQNLLAAIEWVKAQHDVDDKRVGIVGEIAGGVTALFAVNKGLNVRAMVLFSPGAQGMTKNYDLKVKIMDAVQAATAPVFMIQCENDYNLLPKITLGPILAGKGGLNQAKVYPAFGEKMEDAHRFAAAGSAVWQRDVLPFLSLAMN